MTTPTAPARLRPFFAIPAFGLLLACPCPEPPPGVGPGMGGGPGQGPGGRAELRTGAWNLELGGIEVDGRCQGLDPRELEGTRISGWLEQSPEGVVLDLDGVVLRGAYDGRWLELAGTLEEDVGVVVVEEDEEESRPGSGDAGEDDGAGPPPCEIEPEEEGGGGGGGREGDAGLWVELTAQLPAPDLMEGVLVIDYDLPDMRCTVTADFVGRHAPMDGYGHDEPDETEPVYDEDDDGDDGTDDSAEDDCPFGDC